MQEYRAYIIGPDGHVQSRVDLRCKDVAEAFEQAKQLARTVTTSSYGNWIGIRTFKHTRDSFTPAVRAP